MTQAHTIWQQFLSRCLAILCATCALFSSFASAKKADQFESQLIGRWVVDTPAMCNNAKFKGAGIYYFYDKSGKLANELRLPSSKQVQVVRRSLIKSIEVFDESSLVIKTVAQSENLQTNSSYVTSSLIQFSQDFQTQYILDQSMDGIFNIRDSIVLVTKQKQSPFYKCELVDTP